MDRGVRIAARAGVLAAVAAAGLLLASCSPVNLVALLTDEVKRANNKYLVVQGFTPANSATNVNPDAAVTVQFDRAVDMASVTSSTVAVSPLDDIDYFNYSFNSSSNTLSIEAYPIFKDNTVYTVTITTGVLGEDGSSPSAETTWSYTTGEFPSGTMTIEAGGVENATYVTDTAPVTLVVRTSMAVTRYRVATTEAELGGLSWTGTGGDTEFEVSSFSLEGGEGEKVAWIQFADAGSNISDPEFDTIIRDTIPPDPPTWNLTSTTASPTLDNSPTWYWTAGAGGAASYKRRLDGGSDVTTYSSSYTAGSIYRPIADGDHYLEIAQVDAAGLVSTWVAAHHIVVTPCIPLIGATGVTNRPTLQWRAGSADTGYTLYIAVAPLGEFSAISCETPSYRASLVRGTAYRWYVMVASKEGSYRIPALAKSYFTFTTY